MMLEEKQNESVIIALLPMQTDWCKLKFPHMTLIYAGEIPDMSPNAFNAIAKDVMSVALTSHSVTARVREVDVLGDPGEQVQALMLETVPQFQGMRNLLEKWNSSKRLFNPHATIGELGSYSGDRPSYLAFDRIMVAGATNT